MVGTAHGKIILLGEHSVVYGHKAISMPVASLHTSCTLEKASKNSIDSLVYTGSFKALPEALHPFKALVDRLQSYYRTGPFTHTIKSTIPVGAGFGSSAAVATALVRAYDALLDLNMSKATLFEWVQSFETMVHAFPSGIDALSVIHTHAWVFSKAHKYALTLSLNAYLVIADTQERTPTKTSVAHVASHKNTPVFTDALKALGNLAMHGEATILKRDIHALGTLMNQSMKWLRQMDLSTQTMDAYIDTATDYGALGVKLTGGGMGGCIIALCETLEDAQNVEFALKSKHRAPTWVAKI